MTVPGEGEAIYLYIEMFLKLKKPTFRLWTSSIQPAAIQKAYKSMKPQEEYKYLRQSVLNRTLSDYIIGLSGTRAMTLASASSGAMTKLTVGRVQTPVLSLVYDRHIERTKFKKLNYFPVIATFHQNNIHYQGYWVGEKITNQQTAQKLAQFIKNKSGAIIDVQEGNKQTPAPLLMDLTDISRVANERFGYSGMQSLGHLQNLYLKKVITYPRTSSRYITPDELPLMHKTFDLLKGVFPHLSVGGTKEFVTAQNKRLVNVEKIEDHHAILPEPVIPQDLSPDEAKVYSIVVERFFMQFQPPMQYVQKDITTDIEGQHFKSVYKQVLNLGWKRIIKSPTEEETVQDEENQFTGYPGVQKGPATCLDSVLEEKETTPPPAYNDGTLMSMMSNISNKITDPELKEKLKDCGIGTSATRAQIIQKLIDTDYLRYEGKKKLEITKKGITLVETLRTTKINLLTSPEMTAMWEKELQAIRNGKSSKPFMDGIIKFAHQIVSEAKQLNLKSEDLMESYGKCPKCNKPISINQKSYYCTGYKEGCDFYIWKQQYNKNISPKMFEQLLTKGKTGLLKFESKKSAKSPYKARLTLPEKLDNGRLQIEYQDNK